MKNLILPSTLFLALLSSCTQQRYATNGASYENDEVYYQKGDTYITDFALVDNLPDQKPDNYVDPNQVDDYYDPSAQTTTPAQTDDYVDDSSYSDGSGNVTNNYYGDVYQDNSSGWGLNSPYYGNYGWNNWGPYSRLSWNPYVGWTYRYGWGFSSWGFNNWGSCYWNDPWCWNNSWYGSPYYGGWGCGWNSSYYGWGSPYYGWGYGNYYNINNYYGGGGWNGNDDGFGNGIVYGPRPTISVGSSVSSSYEGGTLGHHVGVYEPANHTILGNPSITSPNKPGVQYFTKPAKLPVVSPGDVVSINQEGKLTPDALDTKPTTAMEPVHSLSPANPSLMNPASQPISLNGQDGKLPGNSTPQKPGGDVSVSADREPGEVVIPRDPVVETDYFTVPRKPASANNGNSGSVERPASSGTRPYANSSRTPSGNNDVSRKPARDASSQPANTTTPRQETRPESRPAVDNKPSYKPESRPEVKTPKPEVKAPKPEVRTPKPEFKAPKPESRPTPNPPSVKPPSGGGSRNSGGGGGNSGGSRSGGGGNSSPRKK